MNTKYLDKIVQYMVEDTKIDYDEDQVTYPFIPNHKKSFYITPLTYVQEGSPFFSHFTNYCYNTYGLMDQEISYVWDHYSDIINHKINSKPINESVDNKKEIYLNKIVQYMVEDTKIDYELGEIILPFPVPPLFVARFPFDFINEQHYLRLRYFFQEYLKDTYGLTDNEIYYVWEKYRTNILDKNSKPMNESIDNKKEIYLDKIIEYLMEDGVIDLQRREVRVSNTIICSFIDLISSNPPKNFTNFCRDMYGLDYKDSLYVWNGYSENVLPMR